MYWFFVSPEDGNKPYTKTIKTKVIRFKFAQIPFSSERGIGEEVDKYANDLIVARVVSPMTKLAS